MSSPCSKCSQPEALCICNYSEPLNNRIHVLILQHPQEPDKELGSARLAQRLLKNCTISVGLSWPNLAKALVRKNATKEDSRVTTHPSQWGVLYLGTKDKYQNILNSLPKGKDHLVFLSRKGEPLDNPEVLRKELRGIVLLDGNWAQSKTIWWRNAWLTRLKQLSVFPSKPSIYAELRKEPRKECLSTIESIALSLSLLGDNKKIRPRLMDHFSKFLDHSRNLSPY